MLCEILVSALKRSACSSIWLVHSPKHRAFFHYLAKLFLFKLPVEGTPLGIGCSIGGSVHTC